MKKIMIASSLGLLLMLGACASNEPEVAEPDTDVAEENPAEEEIKEEEANEEAAEEAAEEETPEDAEEDSAVEEPAEEPAEEEAAENADPIEMNPFAFIMENGTTAHFKGEGNEFAEIDLRTDYLDDEHIAVYEDNGGTTMLSVYRVSEDKIELVKEEPEFYEEYEASSEELQALEPISVYMEFPIVEGDAIDGRVIVETGATVETPYSTFENVIVFESKGDDGSINRTYFAENYGEVKREFIMEENGEAMTVTSTLESIERN